MDNLTGGLIQMNAKMVCTDFAEALIIGGAIFCAIFLVLALVAWVDVGTMNKGWVFAFIGLAAVCAVVVVIGNRQPRVKEIRACASGPISLESVATVWDVVSVDGKELVLGEKMP